MRLRRILRLIALQTALVLGAAANPAAVPSAPAPVGPPNGASVAVPFKISWSATLDPSAINAGYNWQVSTSSSFSSLVLMDSTSPSTTEDVVSGLTPGTFFWRVQAADTTGQSAWSPAQSFVISVSSRNDAPSFVITGAGPGAPGTPALGPTRGYSTFHPWESIHFDWTAVPDAVTYRLEISNDARFPLGPVPAGTQTFWFDNVSSNSFEYVHTIVGNWFARVFAVNADNPQTGVRSDRHPARRCYHPRPQPERPSVH